MTINEKGKAIQTPRRPFTVHGHKALSNSVKPMVRVSRPLGDKTPFPNHIANAIPFQSPSPQTRKLAKLSLLEPTSAITPEVILRPSSARKSLRAPRTSGSGKKLEFKTPVTQGNHWDVSDGGIDVGEQVITEEKVQVQEEDYDDIEYMPPTAIIPPYEPPFEMPDYKVVGQTLFELAHSYKIDDTADVYYVADIEVEIDPQEVWKASGFVASPSKWEKLELPELEDDDPFQRASLPSSATDAVEVAPARIPVARSTSLTRAETSTRQAAVGPSTRAHVRNTAAVTAGTRSSAHTSNKIAIQPASARTVGATTRSMAARIARSTNGTVTRATSLSQKISTDVTTTAGTSSVTTTSRRAPAASTRSAANTVPPRPIRSVVAGGADTKGRAVVSRSAMVSRSAPHAAAKGNVEESSLLLTFDGSVGELEEDFAFDV